MLRSGFGHFLEIADASQWDERSLALEVDARTWPALREERRVRLERLLAGFCVGEAGVAAALGRFTHAAADAALGACFRAQARDEERHARFFDRVTAEVLRVPGPTASERRAHLARATTLAFRDLFDERLPSAAARLAAADERLASAVGLCHFLLEGVVFSAGLLTLLDELEVRPSLPGVRRGVELVMRDERWHLGLGVSCLASLEPGPGLVERLVEESVGVASSWGDAVPGETVQRVLALHERRLALARGRSGPVTVRQGAAPAV